MAKQVGMKNAAPRRQRTAFTLIELLVVIAIISILALILFPVFARARENARASSCLSNVKQMGLSIEMYKQDYDSKYPFARGVAPTQHWYQYLDSYIKNKQIQICPSNSDWPIGYSYNVAFGYDPGSLFDPSRVGSSGTYCGHAVPMYDGVGESILTNPSESVVLVDSTLEYYRWINSSPPLSDSSAKSAVDALQPPSTDTTAVTNYNHPEAGIHNGGLNALYADGHAKWRKLDFYFDHTVYCPIK